LAVDVPLMVGKSSLKRSRRIIGPIKNRIFDDADNRAIADGLLKRLQMNLAAQWLGTREESFGQCTINYHNGFRVFRIWLVDISTRK
jgi:hypothetical protein